MLLTFFWWQGQSTASCVQRLHSSMRVIFSDVVPIPTVQKLVCCQIWQLSCHLFGELGGHQPLEGEAAHLLRWGSFVQGNGHSSPGHGRSYRWPWISSIVSLTTDYEVSSSLFKPSEIWLAWFAIPMSLMVAWFSLTYANWQLPTQQSVPLQILWCHE